jgi:hypothetical protein
MNVRMVRCWNRGELRYEVWKTVGAVTEKVAEDLGYGAALDICVRLKLRLGIPTAPVQLESRAAMSGPRVKEAKPLVGRGCRVALG